MENHFLKKILAIVLATPLLLVSGHAAFAQSAPGAQGKTELLWFGQAGFRIKTPEGKMILIDPWITGGPKTPPQYKMILRQLDQ